MKSMQQFKKQTQAGFTLIELMIVVAIIGILAAVAIPQYSNYTNKAKVSNALVAADPLKTGVALCAQEQGGDASGCATSTTAAPSSVPVFTPTKEVASGSVAAGVITLTLASDLGEGIKDKTIKFTPTVGASAVTWLIETTVTNEAAKAAILKNSIGTAPVTGG